MNINDRSIGPGNAPWVCAEISGEHCGSYTKAMHLIAAAKDAGADAAKLQLYDPLVLAEARGGIGKVLAGGLWSGRTLGDLYAEAHTPRHWFPDLFAYAKDIGITLFSSVFDEEGVDYLESLGCPAMKIASFELTDLSLIRKAASTGKPIIISTGMADWSDVVRAASAGGPNAAMLHCVSSYPCRVEDLGLSRMAQLTVATEVFGLSDHTLGSVAPVVATALGASIIEKHITLDRNNGGPDAPFSLEPHEFKRMVQDVKDAYASLGTGDRPKSEDISRAAEDISPMLTEQEQFWRQDFGDEYVRRNRVDWRSRVPFWQDIIGRTKPRSVLEVGCGSGWNLRALRHVDPMLALWGCEINQTALQEAADAGLSVVDSSLFDLKTEWPQGQFDLVASAGVLIHVAPEDISRAMDSIISVSNRYVLAVEYADETEVEVLYRGNAKRLWRRPFGRLYEQRGLKLVAEGEAPAEAFDACAWWLLERP